jgi:site-specific recombinase XerC
VHVRSHDSLPLRSSCSASNAQSARSAPSPARATCRQSATVSAATALEGHVGGFVLTSTRGDPITPDRLGELFHRLVRDADLPPIRLHDLRHGAASLSLAAGNDLKTGQTMRGHSSMWSPPTPTPACWPTSPTTPPKPPHG